MSDEPEVGTFFGAQEPTESEVELAEKILFILSIYPILTHTMVQIAIGTGIAPRLWKPILNRLIDEGKIICDEVPRHTPKGQHRSYTRLYLPGTPLASV